MQTRLRKSMPIGLEYRFVQIFIHCQKLNELKILHNSMKLRGKKRNNKLRWQQIVADEMMKLRRI